MCAERERRREKPGVHRGRRGNSAGQEVERSGVALARARVRVLLRVYAMRPFSLTVAAEPRTVTMVMLESLAVRRNATVAATSPPFRFRRPRNTVSKIVSGTNGWKCHVIVKWACLGNHDQFSVIAFG